MAPHSHKLSALRILLITLACLLCLRSLSPFSSSHPDEEDSIHRAGSLFPDRNLTEEEAVAEAVLIDIALKRSQARGKYLSEVMRATLSSPPFEDEQPPVRTFPKYHGRPTVPKFPFRDSKGRCIWQYQRRATRLRFGLC